MISLNWVNDYVDIKDEDKKELAVKITKAGDISFKPSVIESKKLRNFIVLSTRTYKKNIKTKVKIDPSNSPLEESQHESACKKLLPLVIPPV